MSAAGGAVPDMRLGVLSRIFSNSLCCSRRPIMFSMYNARALFWSFRDLTSASNRRVSSVFPSEDSSSSSLPSSSANEPNPDDCCMASVLVKSPFRVFSLSNSWKLSLSSIKRAFAILTSSSFFSSSCTWLPPILSTSMILICASASSSLKDSITRSFCWTSLEASLELLR